MKLELLGKISKFDPINNKLEFDLMFLTDEQHLAIEEVINQRKPIKFSMTVIQKTLRSLKQFTKMWADISSILKMLAKKNDDPAYLSGEYKSQFYEYIKYNLFPVKYIQIDDKKEPMHPSSKNLDRDEMNLVIKRIQETYDYLGVDWKNEN